MSTVLDTLRKEYSDSVDRMRLTLEPALIEGRSPTAAERKSFQEAAEAERLAKSAFEQQQYEESAPARPLLTGDVRDTLKSRDPEYQAFKKFCQPGNEQKQYMLTPRAEQTMMRVKSYLTTDTGAGSSGAGYLFTDDVYREVVMGLQAASGVLEGNPTLVITNHLRPCLVPVLQADAAATAGVEGSDATAAETDGTGITLGAYRYDGKFTVSAETVMSAEYSVDTLMAQFATRSIANKVAEMLAMGAGATEPHGIFEAATVGKTTVASNSSATPEEVIDLTKSVGKGYRKTACLIPSDALHTQMLQWRNNSGGAGTGDFLLRSTEDGGYKFGTAPVYVEPQADQGGVGAAEVHAVYGDLSGYIVRMTPMLFAKDDSNPLVVVYRYAIWMDAQLADAGCVRSLKTKA